MLRTQHKDGWKFVKVTGIGIYHFEQCQPEDVIYQLDYNQEGLKNKQEYVQMFADCDDGAGLQRQTCSAPCDFQCVFASAVYDQSDKWTVCTCSFYGWNISDICGFFWMLCSFLLA